MKTSCTCGRQPGCRPWLASSRHKRNPMLQDDFSIVSGAAAPVGLMEESWCTHCLGMSCQGEGCCSWRTYSPKIVQLVQCGQSQDAASLSCCSWRRPSCSLGTIFSAVQSSDCTVTDSAVWTARICCAGAVAVLSGAGYTDSVCWRPGALTTCSHDIQPR